MPDSVDRRLAQLCLQMAVEREGHLVFIGGGFVVAELLVITATHVLSEAEKRGYLGSPLVGQDLILVSGERRVGNARVSTIGSRGPEAEDVAFLEVISKEEGFPEKPLPLLCARRSQGNRFTAIGFPPAKPTQLATAAWLVARGTIISFVPRKGAAEVVQLDSQQVEKGFSGSPVYDLARRGIVGMVVQRRRKVGGIWEQAYMLPMEVIWSLHPGVRPELISDRPPVRVHRLERLAAARPYVPRTNLSRKLVGFLEGDQGRVMSLCGLGGSGKTAVVHAFLKSEDWHGGNDRFRAACYSFYGDRSVQSFFSELFQLAGDAITALEQDDAPLAVGAHELELALDASGTPWLIVLDGLEKLQLPGSPPAIPRGRLMESAEALRRFLQRVATGELECAKVLITTRYSLVADLGRFPGFSEEDVGELETSEARELLRALDFEGTDDALDLIPARVGFHALTLDLAARYLARFHERRIDALGDLPRFQDMGGSPDVDHRVARLWEILIAFRDRLAAGSALDLSLLRLVSLFRNPVEAGVLKGLFTRAVSMNLLRDDGLQRPVAAERASKVEGCGRELLRGEYEAAVVRLIGLRLVVKEKVGTDTYYSSHPAVAEFFGDFDADEKRKARQEISRSYRLIFEKREPGRFLEPIEEVIFQEVQSGNIEQALGLYDKLLGYRFFGWTLGSPQRGLEVVTDLLSGGDSFAAELDAGLFLKNLGLLQAAEERFRNLAERERGKRRGVALQNLSAVLVLRGSLMPAERFAREAVLEAKSLGDNRLHSDSTVRVATAISLQSGFAASVDMFRSLLKNRTEVQRVRSLDWPEFRFAWLLLRMGGLDEAAALLERVEPMAKRLAYEMIWARIATAIVAVELRRGHLAEATSRLNQVLAWLGVARDEEMFILCCLLRGSLALNGGDANSSVAHAREGLRAALDGGYGLYRIDLRILEARSLVELGEMNGAKQCLDRALGGESHGSVEFAGTDACGYYWGSVEAKDVLQKQVTT